MPFKVYYEINNIATFDGPKPDYWPEVYDTQDQAQAILDDLPNLLGEHDAQNIHLSRVDEV